MLADALGAQVLRKLERPTSTSDDESHLNTAQGSDSFIARREEGRELHAEVQGSEGPALKCAAGAIDHVVDLGQQPAGIGLVRSIMANGAFRAQAAIPAHLLACQLMAQSRTTGMRTLDRGRVRTQLIESLEAQAT